MHVQVMWQNVCQVFNAAYMYVCLGLQREPISDGLQSYYVFERFSDKRIPVYHPKR